MSKTTAMILAAGRGSRMLHMTESLPKPLVKINGKPLIEYQVERLVAAGITDIVVNVAYFADKIIKTLGFGQRWGISIRYSHEKLGALDTGGGVRQALPWLSDRFLIINADVVCDYDLAVLVEKAEKINKLAHLILVANPDHNPNGDYSIEPDGLISPKKRLPNYTFAGISLCEKLLFDGVGAGQKISLPSLWQQAIERCQVTGELYKLSWCDVGTPERWRRLQNGVKGA
ncbi:MAG: nucleotidyltransferase family protein [Francisellaceae bacterium]